MDSICMDVLVSVFVSILSYFFLLYINSILIDRYTFASVTLSSIAASCTAFFLCGVYKHILRHTTLQEIWRIAVAVACKMVYMG